MMHSSKKGMKMSGKTVNVIYECPLVDTSPFCCYPHLMSSKVSFRRQNLLSTRVYNSLAYKPHFLLQCFIVNDIKTNFSGANPDSNLGLT